MVNSLESLRAPAGLSPDELDKHIVSTILPALEALVKSKDLTNIDLNTLSPALDSLPYLFALNARISGPKTALKKGQSVDFSSGGDLMRWTVAFAEQSDRIQLRYAGSEFRNLLSTLASIDPQTTHPVPIYRLMAALMRRLDPSLGTFTSSHLTFIKACLRNRAYQDALLVLKHDIHSFPPKDLAKDMYLSSQHHLSNGYITQSSDLTSPVTLAHVQEYQLLASMVYIALRDWSEALYHLEHVLVTPTPSTVNGLMVEAYKKWLLVDLMVNGKPQSQARQPKGIVSAALKILRNVAKPYEALVEAFKLGNATKLMAEAHEAQGLLHEDGNIGLAQNVILQHKKLYVLDYANIYSAMPITKISTDLGCTNAEAEQYINSLISKGLLEAEIDAPRANQPSIVRFIQPSTDGLNIASEERLRQELIEQAEKIKALDDHLMEADHRLAMTREYADHERRARKARAEQKTEGGVTDTLDLMGGVPSQLSDDEESMMTDI